MENFVSAATHIADVASPECDWAWHELASIWCEALVHPSSHVRWRVVTTITTTCVRRRERVNQSGGRHMMVMAVKGCARTTTTIQFLLVSLLATDGVG